MKNTVMIRGSETCQYVLYCNDHFRHAIERGNTLNSRARSSRLADSRNMDISSSVDTPDSTDEMAIALEQTGIQTPI